MEPILQLNEFFVEGGNQDQSHVLLHITEPSTPEEQEKGYFFAICEINNAEAKYITKLQDIIDNAENAYYETESRGDKTPLEVILEKINQEAFALIDDEVELHCIIGAIAQPNIVFTYHGNPEALLFYRNRQGAYLKMDLVAQNPEDPESAKKQLFSDVIQGKISVHDYLFLATPHVSNYFTHDRVQKIITARPANQSAQHFEHVLDELHDGYSYGGLVLHIHQPGEVEAIVKKTRIVEKGGSEKSLHSLFNTERTTASTLSPPLFPKAPEKNKTIATPLFPAQRPELAPPEIRSNHLFPHKAPTRAVTPNDSSDKIIEILHKLLPILKNGGRAIVWLLTALYSFIANFFRSIALLFFVVTNYQNRRKTIIEGWRRNWRSRKENFRQMPAITKIIFAVIILAIIGFAGGISYVRVQAEKKAALAAYQETLNQIKTKRDAAESNLIYKNDTAALAELQGAQTLLVNLPCASKEEQNNCTNLKADLERIATQLRKITTVTPEVLAAFPTLVSSTAELVKLDNQIVVADNSSGSVLSYNTETKEIKTLATTDKGITTMVAPKENDYALIQRADGEILKINPKNGAVSSTVVSYPHSKTAIASLLVYSRKLYSLDAANNQIYKHTAIRDGFDMGKEWIKTNPADLSGATDMTIDGDIYVLKTNGQVLKFSSGVEQSDFAIQGLDPALASADKIWTYTDVNNIYILDGAGKRLIVLDKTGVLKQQITAAEFVHPTDMAVDEPGKTAYVIDSGKLYKIPLTF